MITLHSDDHLLETAKRVNDYWIEKFDIGCYVVDFRNYPRGTAEMVSDTFVSMLEELHQEE